MNQDETLAIKTLVLEKVKRSAHVVVSAALLETAELQMVSEMISDQVLQVLFTVEVLGKKEVSEWTDADEEVTAPGIWNNIKVWLLSWWVKLTENREPRWMTPHTIPTRTKHHHAVYHMCPHINEWSRSKTLHIHWLDSAPKPPRNDAA